jgi:hypothetical protein
MLEINLGEYKENSTALYSFEFKEPIEHTEVSCGCLSTSFSGNTVNLSMNVGKVKNPDEDYFNRFVLLKVNSTEYIVKVKVTK